MLSFLDLTLIAAWNIFHNGNIWQDIWLAGLISLFLYSMRVYEKEQLKISKQLSRTAVAVFLSMIAYLLFKLIFRYTILWNLLLSDVLFCFVILVPLRIGFLKMIFSRKRKYYLVCSEPLMNGFINELEQEGSIEIEKVSTVPQGKSNILFASEATLKLLDGKGSYQLLLPKLVEKHLKRIPLELVEAYPNYYKTAFDKNHDTLTKRILDIAVAILALVVLSPVMLAVALAIYFEDGKPIIFKQERIGKDGKKFIIYKFRSMRNVATITPKFADQEQDRITKVGRIIRKLRFDEIPQFINVLKGDMSIVGPRPEQISFHRELSRQIPLFDLRLRCKPGITGWAQVNYQYASNKEEYKKKLEYDLWYIKNGNSWIDIKVMLQTLETIIFKKGAK
ncbi:sugar transferase [Pseudothermotoga thermarum]|uniref:Exopolysaccharide biosynthesis polyprenyl glycosylphosphotransferase n=1 Tax=Pseudothermotoga thermarum DSM 5069 TaxID=688269 RepID=F7YXD2_9THEM|nr:sugar transferase [Pseudothermotoga thermarum]AEH51667.1 exopolysaccharide biosynthesis polyprenyl glycosylphosphotransferase [Pseudothermotoga thermarum DSM 5069]